MWAVGCLAAAALLSGVKGGMGGPLLALAAPITHTAESSEAADHRHTVDGHVLRSASKLQADINASIAASAAGFTIEAGAYYFDDGSPLIIHRAKDWRLATNGHVELWFRVSRKWRTGGVLILECTDISITGITVDYDPPAHYQGEVVATNAASSDPAAAAAAHVPATAACCRRTNVHVASCVKAPGYALQQWDRKTRRWATTEDTNCYPGAGATAPPGADPYPCCHNNHTGAKSTVKISLAACQAGCSSDPACTAIVTGPYTSPPPAPPGPRMVLGLVRTDRGFPDPHRYVSDHSTAKDPSNNYMNAPAIWPKHIGFGCNRTLGCPGHGAGVLLPRNASYPTPAGVASFMLLASARPGDKVTISMRKGLTYHLQNSTRVSTANISIHGASLFGLSEFDGGGGHVYQDVWLGRRRGVAPGQLCGRRPGRLCFGILASNADAFHSSGCKAGAHLRNVTLSNNFDDFLNVHSRLQLLGDILAPTELIVLDPRLQVAQGVPDDTPYGAAETLPNARPGDVLEFHALNTFLEHGAATIASLERVDDPAAIAKYGAAAVAATSGTPPYSMHPAMNAGSAPDVGQLCGAFAGEHHLPACKSRVWKVTLTAPVPAAATAYDIVSLRGWDNAGLVVVNSQFFGGIDGIHSKSNGALFENNTFACTGFDVSPWQHYMEGPPHLFGMTVINSKDEHHLPACKSRVWKVLYTVS